MTFDREAFNRWMAQVDRACQRIAGVSIYDLADQQFADQFLSGMSPREAAREALESEGFPFEEAE